MVDLTKIGEKARKVGSALVIDVSQAMGAHPIDIKAIQPDFLFSVGYKWLLGPYGLCYFYASKKWQELGRPIEHSWLTKKGSENFANLVNYRDDFRLGARRFDMGEFPGFIHVPMAIAALTQIIAWEVPLIEKSLNVLITEIARQAMALGFEVPSKEELASHMIGIDLPAGIPHALKADLNNKKIFVGFRGKGIRVSPYLYNSMDDIERLMSILGKYA